MRRRLLVRSVFPLLVMSLFLGLGPAGDAAAVLTWQIVPSPNKGSLANALTGVATISASDVWAVGEYNPGVFPTVTGRRTLTLRWNGSTWTIVTSADAGGAGIKTTLAAADAAATNDVWAVGHAFYFLTQTSAPIIEHWNGISWQLTFPPTPPSQYAYGALYGIDVIASDNIWAVGGFDYPAKSLILHWDGSIWSPVANPGTVGLVSIGGSSSSDLWAVGGNQILRWNGTAWTVVPSPPPPYDSYYTLQAVDAVAPNDAWAVGWVATSYFYGYIYSPLIMKWNGTAWSVVTATPAGTALYGVEAISPTDVWAVGDDAGTTLIVHWNGATWQRVTSPNPVGGGSLRAVRALSSSSIWAVGVGYDQQSVQRTLTERYGAGKSRP